MTSIEFMRKDQDDAQKAEFRRLWDEDMMQRPELHNYVLKSGPLQYFEMKQTAFRVFMAMLRERGMK